jgi:hypothetical protein
MHIFISANISFFVTLCHDFTLKEKLEKEKKLKKVTIASVKEGHKVYSKKKKLGIRGGRKKKLMK